jgi:DNA-binding response OmpR family regulator
MATTTPATTLNTVITGLRPAAADPILIVEPDRSLQKALDRLFSTEGFEVDIAPEGFTALEMISRRLPSALIFDLPRPGSTGCDFCREIARSAPGLPLMILSANSDVVDKVLLLEMGADDYVTIPFNPRELVARLRALMRRATWTRPRMSYVFENVRVDFARMEVSRCGESITLTPKEFKTLEFLTKNPQRVVSRDELLNEVWGYENYPCTRTVDNHILRLRQKLESDPSDPAHFLTVHGVGYKFAP